MGMPRNPENKRHSTAVRLPADLIDRLDAEAEKRIMGRSKLIELMLAAGLARLEAADLLGSTYQHEDPT